MVNEESEQTGDSLSQALKEMTKEDEKALERLMATIAGALQTGNAETAVPLVEHFIQEVAKTLKLSLRDIFRAVAAAARAVVPEVPQRPDSPPRPGPCRAVCRQEGWEDVN